MHVSADPTMQRQSERVSTEGEPGSKDRRQSLATRPAATGNEAESREERDKSYGWCVCVCVWVFVFMVFFIYDAEQVADSYTSMWKLFYRSPPGSQRRRVKCEKRRWFQCSSVCRLIYHPLCHHSLKTCRCSIWSSVRGAQRPGFKEVLNKLANVMGANPSYIPFCEVHFPPITALRRKPCRILHRIYMWINRTECTQRKGLYHRASEVNVFIHVLECFLMEGQMWGLEVVIQRSC